MKPNQTKTSFSMKKLVSLLLIIGAMFTSASDVYAQCSPDPALTSDGIFPLVLTEACQNQAYSQVITINVPTDTTVTNPIPLTIPIDSIVLDSVVGLPPGFTFQCVPSTCSFPGGTSNCVLLSGTSTVADTFIIDIYTSVWVQVFGTPTVFPVPQLGYYELIVNPSPVDSVIVTPANCGASDGAATAYSSGLAPITYSWSNGDMTATSSNLAAGAYTVTVTDGNGCSETINVNINTGGNVPEINVDSITWVGCAGANSGGIYITAVGGTAPLTYSWSTGATTEDITGLAGGSYSVTVTDMLGCAVAQPITLTEPAQLVLTDAGSTEASCAGNSDAEVSVAVMGGQGPYIYSWTNNANTTGTLSAISAGTYEVSVTDDYGCMENIMLTATEPDSLKGNLAYNDETVLGATDGSASVTPSGGTAPYTYSWSSSSDSTSADSLAPGDYTVTVLDANGCAFFEAFTIAEGPVSIEDELTAGISELNVYPNPSQGIFTIDISLAKRTELSVRLMDINGRIVMQREVGNIQSWRETITVNNYATGIYQLIIDTPQGSASRRLLLN